MTHPDLPPREPFDVLNPLREDAQRISGTTRQGKPCELIDNSGAGLPQAELREVLDGLIAADAFGFHARSAGGGSTIDLDRRESAHIQIGDALYRLVVYRYCARIEPF